VLKTRHKTLLSNTELNKIYYKQHSMQLVIQYLYDILWVTRDDISTLR